MKQIIMPCLGFFMFICLGIPANSQNITIPRTPSPAAEVTQTIGISKVTVNYSRPSVKGREVWGKLVEYGWTVQPFGLGTPSPWRAGANENTTIRFSHEVKVEGRTVPAGVYGLAFVVNRDNTGEVVLSKDSKAWGTFFYEAKNDQLRAPIKLNSIPFTEMLTYDFIDLSKNSATLVLNWEKKQFPVKLEFAVDDIVIANAAEELKGAMGFTWQGFNSAANYALLNKTHLEEGLAWSEKAIALNRSFGTLSVKAGILKEQGKTAEADQIVADAMATSTENELNQYGYQLLNSGQHDKAIEVFTINTKRYPKDPNTWDSLGEAYFAKGDKKNAIANFKKSLSLNPPEGVKANSEKYLKQMNAL